MAQKAIESAVRELSKLVTDLNNKISALECKVDSQTTIIASQTTEILKLRLAVEGSCARSEDEKTTAPAAVYQPEPQRPVRQVRLNAINNKAQVPESRRARKRAPSPLPDSARPAQKKPTSVAIKPAASNATADHVGTLDSTEHDLDGNWKKVIHNKRSQKRKIVSGMGKTDDELQTVEKIKYLQAWSFKPDTTEENVLKYLNKLEQCEEYIVEKRIIKTDKFSSFVIGFPERLYDKLSSPSSWPPQVKVSDWFRVRPRVPRGVSTTASTDTGMPAVSRG